MPPIYFQIPVTENLSVLP